jgi:hypothetical protein
MSERSIVSDRMRDARSRDAEKAVAGMSLVCCDWPYDEAWTAPQRRTSIAIWTYYPCQLTFCNSFYMFNIQAIR